MGWGGGRRGEGMGRRQFADKNIKERERKEKGKPRRRARNERAERASISTKPKRAPGEGGRLDAQVSGESDEGRNKEAIVLGKKNHSQAEKSTELHSRTEISPSFPVLQGSPSPHSQEPCQEGQTPINMGVVPKSKVKENNGIFGPGEIGLAIWKTDLGLAPSTA